VAKPVAGGAAFGGAAGAATSLGKNTGGGGFAKPPITNSGGLGAGGFAKPSATNTGVGGGGFVKPSAPAAANPGFANSGGVPNTAIGGGGFVKPNTNQGSVGSVGGGGFNKPSGSTGGGLLAAGALGGGAGGLAGALAGGSRGGSSASKGGVGSSFFGNSKLGSGSSKPGSGLGKGAAGVGLAGALGGLAAGKAAKKQYSYPKVSKISNIFKPKSITSKGYGTAWGTKFKPDSVYKQKKGFSKKALGLGVAAGFIGGAAVGVAGTMATYSVYHRYQEFKNLMRMRGFGDYENNGYYSRNECLGGCPASSHCEWGFCECDYGFERRFGHCGRIGSAHTPRPVRFDPFVSCANTAVCQNLDINMICNTELTVQSGGKCQCKSDMKWNQAAQECQIFIDVDCSAITYDTPPSKFVLNAVARAEQNNISQVLQDSGRTPTIEESIGSSLLSQIDRSKATEAQLREAYCRDVDAFSFDFNIDDGKPTKCSPVPRSSCGVVYDSGSCNGGWNLKISEGEISFPYFSSYWKYRNDIDLIGVRAGCTLTAFSDTGYSGKRGTFRAEANDRWWVLKEYAEFLHLHEDIESIQCVCRRT